MNKYIVFLSQFLLGSVMSAAVVTIGYLLVIFSWNYEFSLAHFSQGFLLFLAWVVFLILGAIGLLVGVATVLDAWSTLQRQRKKKPDEKW